jgi:hypothetical protein
VYDISHLGQDNKQYVSIKLNDKDAVNITSGLLAKIGEKTLAYTFKFGHGLLGQISAAVLLKHFSRPLNMNYKEHYNLRLSSKKNINIHNEFLQEPHYPDNPRDKTLPPIKDIAYMFTGVSTGFRHGKLANSELVSGQEIELENSCSIVHKQLSFESIELFGGFEPLLVVLSRISIF